MLHLSVYLWSMCLVRLYTEGKLHSLFCKPQRRCSKIIRGQQDKATLSMNSRWSDCGFTLRSLSKLYQPHMLTAFFYCVLSVSSTESIRRASYVILSYVASPGKATRSVLRKGILAKTFPSKRGQPEGAGMHSSLCRAFE